VELELVVELELDVDAEVVIVVVGCSSVADPTATNTPPGNPGSYGKKLSEVGDHRG
jgi:hypothetical protein